MSLKTIIVDNDVHSRECIRDVLNNGKRLSMSRGYKDKLNGFVKK